MYAVSGVPELAVKLPFSVQPVKSLRLPAAVPPQSVNSHRRREQVGQGEAVPLVDDGKAALRAQIERILHQRAAAAAGEARSVVDRFRERVERHGRHAAREAARQPHLSGVEDGIARGRSRR